MPTDNVKRAISTNFLLLVISNCKIRNYGGILVLILKDLFAELYS